jgi:hypothetical protein
MAPSRTHVADDDDDGWGELVGNTRKTFPHGMKYMGDYFAQSQSAVWNLLERLERILVPELHFQPRWAMNISMPKRLPAGAWII